MPARAFSIYLFTYPHEANVVGAFAWRKRIEQSADLHRGRFIEEDQLTSRPLRLIAPPLSPCLLHVRARLLAGAQSFF